MKNGWFLSKIISSEFFLPLVVGIIGCLKVSGVITVGNVESTANLLTNAVIAVMTMVLGSTYAIERISLKKTVEENKPEVLG